MSQKLPQFGNPFLLAQGCKSYSGELALACFDRLAEFLAADHGAAHYEIAFTRDADSGAQVRGEVGARLPLTCQRCLERFEFPVKRHWRLALIEDPAQEQLLDEDQSAFLVPDGEMRLSDFIEDELILALPLVPRHPVEENCRLPGDVAEQTVAKQDNPNPFASLEALKRNH